MIFFDIFFRHPTSLTFLLYLLLFSFTKSYIRKPKTFGDYLNEILLRKTPVPLAQRSSKFGIRRILEGQVNTTDRCGLR